MQTGFRADIQGLRAVAVLVVIAFHAGLPLSGGFVGVDVFFVISGFVITAMLMREWDLTGSVSLARFYLRRAKRLTPALALVVALTAIASSLFLSPFDQQVQSSRTGLGALGLVANWVIDRQTGDYFGPSAESNPLLHTWSLSVEEQFYLAFPVTLLAAWRLGKRVGRAPVAALLVVTFLGLASLGMIRGSSLGIPAGSWVIGYYSSFNRAWEFAAGAFLALLAPYLPRIKPVATVAGGAGLALLVLSVTVIDSETPFPGKWTLVPVIGSTLCLAAGSLHPDNWVSHVLSLRPSVKVGDWSYSLYLWHWPFIVIAHALFPLVAWAPFAAALVCVAPAVMSYTWVEMPMRAWTIRPLRSFLSKMTTVVGGSALLAAISWTLAVHVWVPAYDSGGVPVSHAAGPERPEAPGVACEWNELAKYIGENGGCRQSWRDRPIDVVVLGDSHAEHLYPGVIEALPSRNVALTAFRSPEMFGSRTGLDLAIDSILETNDRPTVLISRFWTRGPLHREDQFQPLEHAVRRFSAADVDVVLVDDVPDFAFPVSACTHRIAPVIPVSLCDQSRERVEATRSAYLADLRSIAAAYPGTRVVEVGLTLCNEQICSMLSGDTVAYSDSDHLNLLGSRMFADRVVRAAGLTQSPGD